MKKRNNHNLNSSKMELFFDQETPKSKKSPFFYVLLVIIIAIVSVSIYKSFASNDTTDATNVSRLPMETTNVIGQDFDGTSDGTYNLTIVGGGGNTRHWDGSDSTDWHVAANWAENLVPSACSTVIIDGDVENFIGSALDYYDPILDLSGGSEGIANLYLGTLYEADPDSTPTTLEVSYGSETNKLVVTGDVVIGDTVSTAINGTLTHTANGFVSNQEHVLNLEVGGDFTINTWGTVDVTGKGYYAANGPGTGTGVASYGAYGFSVYYNGGFIGTPYGSITEPDDLGSSMSINTFYGKGAGAIKISANNMQIDGTILSNGYESAGACGTGGSVWLDVNGLSGAGIIKAEGSGSSRTCSGGRIAVYYNDSTFSTSNISTTHDLVSGGTYVPYVGSGGTIYLKDKDNANDYGTLIIDNKDGNDNPAYGNVVTVPQWTDLMDPANKEMTYSNIQIKNKGKYVVTEGATLNILDTTVNSGTQSGELRNSGTVNFKEESTGNPLADYTFSDSFTFNEDAKNGVVNGLTGTLTIDNAGLSTFNTGDADQYAWNLPGNVTVQNGSIVTHSRNKSDQENTLNLNVAGTFSLGTGSQINADGKGHTDNVLHAGDYVYVYGNTLPHGNNGTSTTMKAYGSITEPVSMGSGGYHSYGGFLIGGGAIKISADNLQIDGNVTAEEKTELVNASGNDYVYGSGGSIWLDANILSITSSSLLGVAGFPNQVGGDGRIAVYYNDKGSLDFHDVIRSGIDAAGTFYFKDKDDPNDQGNLIIDSTLSTNTNLYTPQYTDYMDPNNQEMTYSSIEILNYGKYVLENGNILNILDTTTNAGDITGELINSGTVNFKEESTGNPLADYAFSNSFTFNEDAKNGTTTGLTGTLTIDNAGLSTFNTTGSTGILAEHAWELLGNLNVINGGVVTHTQNTYNSNTQTNSLNLDIAGNLNIDVNSKIDVTAKGFNSINFGTGPGRNLNAATTTGVYSIAFYGGKMNGNYPNNNAYGLILEPVELGSASGTRGLLSSTKAGGAVKVFVGGNANIQGDILANKFNNVSDYSTGGSIWLNVDGILSGSADTKISASSTLSGSGKCGGRLAIYYGSLNFSTGSLEDSCEAYGGSDAGAGTIYLKNKTTGDDKLIIDNNGYLGYITPQQADLMPTDTQDFTVSTLEIKGGGKYEVGSDDTLLLPTSSNILGDTTGNLINNGLTIFTDSNTTIDSSIDIYNYATLQGLSDLTMTGGSDLYHSATGSLDILDNVTIGNGSVMTLEDYNLTSPLVLGNLTIENGGTLTHKGNTTSQANILNLLVDNLTVETGGEINVNSKGYKTENGPGAATAGYSGGSYGGIGGGTTPGATYGSETNPVDLGSGGDYYSDFFSSSNFGGGMVRAQISNTLTVDGEIHADGSDNNYGASSGGTVFLSTNNFKGTGFITADGGTDSGVEDGGGGRIAIYYEDTNISGDHFLLPGNGSITYLDANPITMTDNDPIGGDDPTNLTKQGTLYIGYPDHYEITGNNTQVAGTSQNINVTLIDNNGNPFIISGDKDFTFSGANPSPNGTEPTILDKNLNSVAFSNLTPLSLVNGSVFTDMTLYNVETAEIETTDGLYDTLGDQNYDLDVNVTETTPDESQTTIDTLVNPVLFGNNVEIVVTPKDSFGNQIKNTGSTVILDVSGANIVSSLATNEVVDGLTGFVTYTASYLATNSGIDEIAGNINSNTIINDEDGTSDGVYHQVISGTPAAHLEIDISGDSGSVTPVAMVAGIPQTITITAKDSNGNIDSAYSGLKNITITGANNSPDGTNPTTQDDGGVDISMTDSPASVTVLNFINGIATSQMYLYKQEIAEIEASDGTINTLSSQDYDLNVEVNNSGIDYSQSLLEVNKFNVKPNDEVTITVITRDAFQNPLILGGETVIASISGDNPVISINLNDNSDGTYSTTDLPLTHHIPTNIGEDLIIASVSGNAVIHDNDGLINDGTFHLFITDFPKHIEITGNNTQVAGTSQTITLTVKNSVGTVDDTYDGIKLITFSGATVSNQGNNPNINNVDFGSVVNLNFVDGVANADMNLFKVETAEIEATDGTISTFDDQNYDLDVNVIEADACLGTLNVNPNPVEVNNHVDITLNNITDQYGNAIIIGGNNPNLKITGVNPTLNLSITDNNNGTYSSEYIPSNDGLDILSGTLGVCSLNSFNITVNPANFPVCGNNAKTYLFEENTYQGDFCQLGVSDPNSPDFPDAGNVVNWKCNNNGLSVDCQSTRESEEVKNDSEKEVDFYNIKNVECNSLDLRAELKNFSDENDKFDFKVDVKNLDTGEKYKLKFKSEEISDNNKITLHIDNLSQNTNYQFRVEASIEGKSKYTESKKEEVKTKTCEVKKVDTIITTKNVINENRENLNEETSLVNNKIIDSEIENKTENIFDNDIDQNKIEILTESENDGNTFDELINDSNENQSNVESIGWKIEKIKSKLPIFPWISVLGILIGGLLLIPFRTRPVLNFMELFGLFTKKSKDVHWGTVFEVETKLPIVAAKIILMDSIGRELEVVYSDKHGRYGFLAEAGNYFMHVYKSNYSLVTDNAKDPVYGDLYVGKFFTIKKDDLIVKNIAMKSNKLDWKKYAKKRINAYNSKFRIFKDRLLLFIHVVCFLYTIIATVIYPNKWNIAMIIMYVIVFIVGLIFKEKKYGTLATAKDNKPIPFGVINLYNEKNKRREAFAISDTIGRYFLLTENGSYILNTEGNLLEGGSFNKKGKIRVRDGVVKTRIKV